MSLITIDKITKTYHVGTQDVHALRGVSINIEKGEYVSIMGSSGSGKSTLMNMIGGLDTPSTGRYILNGNNVNELNDDRLAAIRNSEIGFVFQTFNLLQRSTALDNVCLPLIYAGVQKQERIKRASDMLKSVGLGDRMDHKPSEMSGGQRQRVAVARALVNRPSLLLADEPTGNLDSRISEEVMKLFAEIHRNGNTLIVVTHEEEIAQHAHRIIRLKDGLVESDLVNENPVY